MLVCKLHYFSETCGRIHNSVLKQSNRPLFRFKSCGAVAILIVAAGLFLGRLSYNDAVDDLVIQGLQKKLLFNNFNI